ncbi:MAG: response regulator [Patescibacteria group bacterium]|jgi:two-component system alkaline phosphatase synthesis response regulator PhoP
MSKKKILIIEDEKVLLEILEKKLLKEGFDVYVAEDGQIGLEQVQRVKPDLVLLDIVMPRLNGYEVLEEMNKRKMTIPPVIIISNSGQPVEIDRAMRLGARDCIVKAELTPAEVVEKVKSLLLTISAEDRPSTGAHTVTSSDKKSINVLVIEDDQFLRDLLRTKLEREKFFVTTAIDGPEALERLETDHPDIVLLDVILPGVDGFEILKHIKSTDRIKKVPVVLLSNLGQETDVERGKALGATDYLIKSNFTIDEIIEKIHALVKRA